MKMVVPADKAYCVLPLLSHHNPPGARELPLFVDNWVASWSRIWRLLIVTRTWCKTKKDNNRNPQLQFPLPRNRSKTSPIPRSWQYCQGIHLSRRSNNILLTSANRWFAYGTKITKPGLTIRPLMPTEIVSYVTFSYSYLWAANVTFIIDKTGCFNCNVCMLTARSRQVRNCPRTQRVVCLALAPVPVEEPPCMDYAYAVVWTKSEIYRWVIS
jgi:hypothetical protein